jgi:hypothetical protein
MGSALAIVQSLFSLSFMFFYARVLEFGARTEKSHVETNGKKPPLFLRARESFTWRGVLLLSYLVLICVVILGRLLSVFAFSVIHQEGGHAVLSLKSYHKISLYRTHRFLEPLRPIHSKQLVFWDHDRTVFLASGGEHRVFAYAYPVSLQIFIR